MKATHKEWSLSSVGDLYLLKCTDQEGEEKQWLTKEQLESLKEFMLGLGDVAGVGKEESCGS